MMMVMAMLVMMIDGIDGWPMSPQSTVTISDVRTEAV